MKQTAREIDSELAPEMGWRDFILKCFRYKRFLVCSACGIDATCETTNDSDRVEFFLDSGWRYERTFDGVNPKCADCARKSKRNEF